jgi:hypothetical protein
MLLLLLAHQIPYPPTLRHSFQGPSCLSHITYKELYGIGYLKSRRLLSKGFFQG